MSALTNRQAVGDPLVKTEAVEIWNIMKSIMKPLAVTILVWAGCVLTALGQGAFTNLDFESANVSGYSPGDTYVPVNDAMPGWKAYYGGIQSDTVVYDNASLGAPAISLNDSKFRFGFVPLEGNFSASLEGRYETAAIGQSGQVPADSMSVVFWLSIEPEGLLQVSFAGNVLPFYEIGTISGVSIIGADISPYAGLNGELRFTELNASRAVIDGIQFSPGAVPEPGTMALFALGAIILFGVSPHY